MKNHALTHPALPGVIFHQQNNHWRVRLQTSLNHADIISAQPIDYSDSAARDTLSRLIQQWRSAGYVMEDAATLGIFEQTCQLAGDVSFARNGKYDATYFPRFVDITRSDATALRFPGLQDAQPGIYPIVDRLDQFQMLLDAGARIIQLRIKSNTVTPEIRSVVANAAKVAQAYPQSQFFLNDYWQLAIEFGVYGVHLGQEDLLTADLAAIQKAGLRLGVSSHAFWEVARAMTISPSYIACGPIFPTRAKAMPWIAQGLDNLRYWSRLIPHPVVGIGGINSENLKSVHATGCASASIIQAIVSAPDPAAAYRQLQSEWIGNGNDGRGADDDGAMPLARPTLASV
jgi:thiamine-phosphate diphosphorylase